MSPSSSSSSSHQQHQHYHPTPPATPLSAASSASSQHHAPHYPTHRHRRIHKRTIDRYLKLHLNAKSGNLDLMQDSGTEDSAYSSDSSTHQSFNYANTPPPTAKGAFQHISSHHQRDSSPPQQQTSTAAAAHHHNSSSSSIKRRRKWFSASSRLQFISRPSLLSVDSKVKAHNYQGITNLIILMLIVSHARLMLENLMKYGLLVSLSPLYIMWESSRLEEEYWLHAIGLLALLASLTVLSFACELLAAKSSTVYRKVAVPPPPPAASSDDVDESSSAAGNSEESPPSTTRKPRPFIRPNPTTELLVLIFHFLICSTSIMAPIWFIFTYEPHPALGMLIELASIVLFLKLVSYAHMNARYRRRQVQPGQDDVQRYPNNIRFGDMVYFMIAPTLVYQEVFPRTPRIRKSFLLKRAVELFFCCVILVFMSEQYILPLVENAMEPISKGQWLIVVERMMKLTIPVILVWLVGFYAFFHDYLNIVAELLHYGDRLFYMDWWNCTSLAKFWRNWNIPVSQWMVFHIYLPLIQNKICGQKGASFIAFLVSAIFHEMAVSIPFRTFKLWAFAAMLVQMPLCVLTEMYTKGRTIGNMIFWLSFLFGQSNIVCLYYYDTFKGSLGG